MHFPLSTRLHPLRNCASDRDVLGPYIKNQMCATPVRKSESQPATRRLSAVEAPTLIKRRCLPKCCSFFGEFEQVSRRLQCQGRMFTRVASCLSRLPRKDASISQTYSLAHAPAEKICSLLRVLSIRDYMLVLKLLGPSRMTIASRI